MRVQFVPVGRVRREWTWAVRDERSNTIAISGQRFVSLSEAMRDVRQQIDGQDRARPGDRHRPR